MRLLKNIDHAHVWIFFLTCHAEFVNLHVWTVRGAPLLIEREGASKFFVGKLFFCAKT